MKEIARYFFTLFVAVPRLLIAQIPVANFSATDTAICNSSFSENFTDLSTNSPTNWKWYFPGAVPDTSTLKNPTNIIYNGIGCYTVKLVVKNSSGSDSLIDSNYICIDALPHIVFTGLSSCPGATDTITVSGGTQYLWSGGETTSSISLVPIISFTFAVRVYNGACSEDTVCTLLVDTMPNVMFRGDTSICIGDTSIIHVISLGVGGFDCTYLWNTGSTADSIIINGATPGSYTYYVNVSKGACSRDSVPITVYVHACTGIENYSDPLGIEISPNPSNGSFTLSVSNVNEKCNVEIFNILGEDIYQANLNSNNTEINLSAQPQGVYLLKINEGNKFFTKKIVKED